MPTLAESAISSTSRPLCLRMRPDLSARQQRYHGRTYWVVKEPVGLNYFRFHEEEYAILCMMDGQASLDDIKEQFEDEYLPQKITYNDLQQFIGMLYRSGLLISDAPGQGKPLRKRRDDKKRRELISKFSNIFALRFRGVDPERFFDIIYPYVGWVFSPIAIILFMTFALSALTLVMVEFDYFRSKLPTFHQFFGPHNWIWLGITMAAVKVLHEFGHGLSCRHYGGECHEIGLMFLVFTPCLYCNVSDSWMLPNKWHRAFIGAAGMYIEVILASFATYLWWFSQPGLLNQICLSVVFICSVSTILFNGNPLLRFDGYYILMDLAEIPNLSQKSTEVLKRFLVQLCLGIEQPENPFLPQQRQLLFGIYTVASAIYRWVVVFSIMFFCIKLFEPYGLKILGQFLAIGGLFGLVVQPLIQLVRFFYVPGRMHKVKRLNLGITTVFVAALILAIAFVPLPFHIKCSLEVQPRGAEAVFARVPGRLREVVAKPGMWVERGQVLARLENVDLQLALASLQGEKARLEAQLETLIRRRFKDERVAMQIPTAKEILEAVEDQLVEKQQDVERLEISAPISGQVFPPPFRQQRNSEDGRLPGWSGFPFDRQNEGAHFAERDQLCQIGDPKNFDAILVIDQNDIDLLSAYEGKHQKWPEVEIKLDAFRWDTISGRIAGVASAPMEISPQSLASQGGGELNTKADASGMLRPISTSYQARVPLDSNAKMLRVGMTGRAKVYTGWQPLGTRIARFVYRTFHFQW
jgi:putative peptide zinc metalloprotease protein